MVFETSVIFNSDWTENVEVLKRKNRSQLECVTRVRPIMWRKLRAPQNHTMMQGKGLQAQSRRKGDKKAEIFKPMAVSNQRRRSKRGVSESLDADKISILDR